MHVNMRMCVYVCAYMALYYAIPSLSLYEALLVKQRTFLGMKKASKLNLHIVKMSCRSMKAMINHFSRRKFTDKLPLLNTCLVFSYQTWEAN